MLGLLLLAPRPSWSAGKTPRFEKLGYRDADNDGRNDLFRDANGDGINDINGKPYRHNFPFADADGDGKNDLFQDADGDGINDLYDRNRDKSMGNAPFAIDFDEDGVNDVTGKNYDIKMQKGRFIDEDGDGIRDTMTDRTKSMPPGQERVRKMDRFTDEDGDGINDGRGLGREMRDEGKQRQGMDKNRKRNQ